MKRRLPCAALVVLLVLCLLCGCGSAEAAAPPAYRLPEKLKMTASGRIAENDRFALDWDYEGHCVILTDLLTGGVWATTPYDYYADPLRGQDPYRENGLRSMLNITYIEAQKELEMQAGSFNDALQNGFVSGKKIKNGIRLTFYFNKLEISIPVEFTLEQDGVSVSLPIHDITEGENRIYSVSLLPFFASAQNGGDSYLLVPSGAGALMRTDDASRAVRRYSEPVYGEDAVSKETFENIQSETVRLPVFGAKNGKQGLFGVITEGAELASVEAVAGDKQYGYSAAYASFRLRGKATSVMKDVSNINAVATKYTDALSGIDRVTVRYFALNGDQADYNGMAAAYRGYLRKDYKQAEKTDTSNVMLDILGGEQTKKYLLGVPIKTTDAATTFSQAKEILADFKKSCGEISVRLRGFSAAGLDYGKPAGGFTAAGRFGGKSRLKSLSLWCEEQGISLFYDFDAVFYNRSGAGYSVRKAAVTANTVRAEVYSYDLVTHKQDQYQPSAFLLGREDLRGIDVPLKAAAEKLSLGGVGLSSLSNTAYSDYRSDEFYEKSNMGADVKKIFSSLKKAGLHIMSDGANEYAALLSDCVFGAPSASSKDAALDEELPFYQMIFHDMINLSSPSINLAVDPETAFLQAMSTGSSLSFTVTDHYNEHFQNGYHEEFAFAVYGDIADRAKEYATRAAPLLDAVEKSAIISFERTGELTRTRFENGARVYVNFGSSPIETDIGRIEAHSFAYHE